MKKCCLLRGPSIEEETTTGVLEIPWLLEFFSENVQNYFDLLKSYFLDSSSPKRFDCFFVTGLRTIVEGTSAELDSQVL